MSSSYEWMELQTLTAEIEVSRSRLGSARAKRDHGHIRALQEEIATAERRRDKLLHYISINLAGVPEDARPPEGMKGAELREALAVAAAAAAPDAAADAVAAAQRAKSADETPVAVDEAVSAEAETERPSREAGHGREQRCSGITQGIRSSRRVCGWPLTIRVMTSAGISRSRASTKRVETRGAGRGSIPRIWATSAVPPIQTAVQGGAFGLDVPSR
jgi:hypothetical protein